MKNRLHLACLALLMASLPAPALRAEETLWNVTFTDLKPGEAPKEAPFVAPSANPQRVTTDAQDTLAGASNVGALPSALLFTKGGSGHYLPALIFKGTTPITSGVITVKWDLAFDKVTPGADHPVTVLMAFPFINGKGGMEFIPLISCSGANDLFLGGAGFAKNAKPLAIKIGDVAHLKAVLDLNQHTFQLFLNDIPWTEPEHDDAKFASFLGFTIRDGTALGGNNGEAFTVGIANLLITHG